MAILVDCAFCHSRVRAPDAMAGREAECPKCGVTLTIPPRVDADADYVEVKAAPTIRSASLPVRDRDHHSDEPWPYKFIDGYAKVGMILGGLSCFLGWAVSMIFVGQHTRDDGTILLAFLGTAVAWVVVFLGIVFNCALVQLCVDAARNIRAIRRRLADGERPGDASRYS